MSVAEKANPVADYRQGFADAQDDPGRYADDYHGAHTAFYEAVVAACPSPWLLRLRRLLFSQHERYRRLSRPLAAVERDLAAEHAAIAEAALARDADRCVALMDDHLAATARILVEAGTRGFAAPESKPGAR